MMTSTGDEAIPKLVDFGLACIMGPGEKANKKVGTVTYMAPEIL